MESREFLQSLESVRNQDAGCRMQDILYPGSRISLTTHKKQPDAFLIHLVNEKVPVVPRCHNSHKHRTFRPDQPAAVDKDIPHLRVSMAPGEHLPPNDFSYLFDSISHSSSIIHPVTQSPGHPVISLPRVFPFFSPFSEWIRYQLIVPLAVLKNIAGQVHGGSEALA